MEMEFDTFELLDEGAELAEDELEHVVGGLVSRYLKLGDIKGESTDSKHGTEIDVL